MGIAWKTTGSRRLVEAGRCLEGHLAAARADMSGERPGGPKGRCMQARVQRGSLRPLESHVCAQSPCGGDRAGAPEDWLQEIVVRGCARGRGRSSSWSGARAGLERGLQNLALPGAGVRRRGRCGGAARGGGWCGGSRSHARWGRAQGGAPPGRGAGQGSGGQHMQSGLGPATGAAGGRVGPRRLGQAAPRRERRRLHGESSKAGSAACVCAKTVGAPTRVLPPRTGWRPGVKGLRAGALLRLCARARIWLSPCGAHGHGRMPHGDAMGGGAGGPGGSSPRLVRGKS